MAIKNLGAPKKSDCTGNPIFQSGFPLQVLAFARAKAAGFPLQSLAQKTAKAYLRRYTIRRPAGFFLTVIFFAALSLPGAFAQDSPAPAAGNQPPPNYYIDRSGQEPRFIQRLMWEEADYVLRYEVVVQRRDAAGNYTEAARQTTTEAAAEFSLPAGHYRYHVEIYDLLDARAFTTEWREFDIIRALQPELTGFSPAAFNLDENAPREITLSGRNLLPESEIYLSGGGAAITPLSHTSTGDSSRLVFSEASLTPGDYSVYVRNPGGLDTQLGTFRITNRKPFDLYLSFGYAPVIPLYGYLFKDSRLEAPFPGSFYPAGAAARAGFLPAGSGSQGKLGAEISASWAPLSDDADFYSTEASFLNAHVSLLYQKYFFGKTLAFNANLGAGLTTLQAFHYNYPAGLSTKNKTTYIPSAAAGFSCMAFISRGFYIHAGMDIIHAFSRDTPMPGFIRPFIMAGCQL